MRRGQIVWAIAASGAIAITLLLAAGSMAATRGVRIATRSIVAAIAVAAVAVLAATIGPTASKSAPTKASAQPRVAFLIPANVMRWEGFDSPAFVKAMKKLYSGVSVDVLGAWNNPDLQKSQAENEVAKGAKVLVVAAIDGKAFGAVAKRAIQQGVKVVAYDRLITGARISAYVSFNSVTVGHAMGAWMKAHTKHGARQAEEPVLVDFCRCEGRDH